MGQSTMVRAAGKNGSWTSRESDRRHTRERQQSYRSHTGPRTARAFRHRCNEEISMCGYGAAVAMLTAVRHMGATLAELGALRDFR